MTDTVNVPEVFDRQRRRIVRDRACARSTGDDFFSQIMVEEILERLDVVKRTFRRALIIGLPAKRLGTELKSRGMKVVFADASARLARSVNGVICDDDRLPFADHSFDLIINIGSLDTINDLPGALVLIRRILLPDGLMLAALIGAESFPSLKSVMMEAERDRVSAHIHPQIDVRTAGDLVARAGLTLPVADSDLLRLKYSSLQRLIADIRDVGGSNIMTGNLTAIRHNVQDEIQRLFRAQAGPDGKFAENVTILYLCAWAPHPDQPKPARRGSGQVSLTKTLSGKHGDGGSEN
ncbi:class I SAM-dependent methyltransferase [Parasphingorhabdus sp.]|uniref:class I SAM-dependent methyltransferase n=1 Tax=Parasphingorhabdus sp. TaxID=2709688 RepID=UPI003A9469BD